MEILNNFYNGFIMLIIVGASARIMQYAIKIAYTDEKDIYIKKIKMLIIAVIGSLSITGIKEFVELYFK